MSDSPVEARGLRSGDLILEIDFIVMHDLKGLSEILKSLNPGDTISITFLHAEKEITAKPKMVAK